MQSRNPEFIFSANFNFASDNLLNYSYPSQVTPLPPSGNALLLTDGTNFLLTDGTDFLLAQ